MKIEKNPLTRQLSIWLTTTADGIQYTCPMHSHILQSEPGFCSICGMALEPVIPAGIENRFQLNSFSNSFAKKHQMENNVIWSTTYAPMKAKNPHWIMLFLCYIPQSLNMIA